MDDSKLFRSHALLLSEYPRVKGEMLANMKIIIIAWAVFTSLLVEVQASLKTCASLDHFPLIRGKDINHLEIDVIKHTGLVTCAAQCKFRKVCKSFSFRHDDGLCKLFKIAVTGTPNNVVGAAGVDVSNIEDWPSVNMQLALCFRNFILYRIIRTHHINTSEDQVNTHTRAHTTTIGWLYLVLTSNQKGARYSSVVREFRSWCDGSSDRSFMVDSLGYFSFQPVSYDWCKKGCDMCYPVCGMVHIK